MEPKIRPSISESARARSTPARPPRPQPAEGCLSSAFGRLLTGSAEKRILSSIIPELFCADVVDFAEIAARRVYDDHALFRRDHACGAFQYWDSE